MNKLNLKRTGLYIMSVLYIAAGIGHFINPATFLKIMPDFLPSPLLLVYLSGICEVLFGVLILFAKTRKTGAWLIILLLIAVFPANIKMASDFYAQQHPYLWVALLRLPLQFVLIWWAWLYTRPAALLPADKA